MSVEYREPARPDRSQRVYLALRAKGLRAFPKHDIEHQIRLAPSMADDIPDDAMDLRWFGYPVVIDSTLSVDSVIVEDRPSR